MQIVETIEDLRMLIPQIKRHGKTVGLIPTMGALHEGHLTLVREAKKRNGLVVVSIFVNPTQFGPGEDFTRYPRPIEDDIEKCRAAEVDMIFAPTPEVMYPQGFGTFVDVEGLTDKLEGEFRPGHFRGVATIVLKLFAAVEPNQAYFGMKDYQQLKVIEKMVRDMNVKLEIVPVPTVREDGGLAMSSRNAYLSPEEREAALVLYKALSDARDQAWSGETDAEAIRQAMIDRIEAEHLAVIDYVAVVHPETLEPIETIEGGALAALAVKFGKTRLIDNMLIYIGT